ncbi:MAG TPA: prolipoprotein diacylglyceryl transferase [bacterium]
MYPILFTIGPFSLHTYGLAMAVAFGLGIWIAMKRADAHGFGAKYALDLSIMILIFSLVGARFAYVVTHWDEFAQHPLDIISPVQHNGQIGIAGLVLLGGVAAAFATVYYYSRRHGHTFLSTTDLFIPSTALGIAIGRVGCFFNGCCFGEPCDAAWCVVFPKDSLAGYIFPNTPVHPTQLYETTAMLLLFGAMMFYDRHRHPEGRMTGIFLLAYGVWRFFNESLRWYENEMIVFQTDAFRLTVSQVLSAIMVVCGAYLLWRSYRKGAARSNASTLPSRVEP